MPFYPAIDIRVMPWDRDPARLAVYFTDRERKVARLMTHTQGHSQASGRAIAA